MQFSIHAQLFAPVKKEKKSAHSNVISRLRTKEIREGKHPSLENVAITLVSSYTTIKGKKSWRVTPLCLNYQSRTAGP